MAGDWLKFEKATLDKPEVFEMAGILGIDPDAVVGKLLRVWDWFDDQSPDGYAPVTLAAQLNRNTGVTGFVEAMQRVGWLTVESDKLKIPNFERHNGQSAKVRSLSAKRMAKSRGKSYANSYADGVTSSVTKTQPEKRREEKSNITPISPKGESAEKSRLPKSEQAIRLSSLFNRRLTTAWSEKEIRSFKAIGEINMEDINDIESYYRSERAKGDDGRHRRDLLTFLNNYAGELDRARASKPKQEAQKTIRFLD